MLSFIKNIFKGTLRKACKKGDIEAVKQHLAAGVNVNAKDETSWTPLHFATTKAVAELLITKGADVNAKNDTGETPLHQAAFDGHREIVELSSGGADLQAAADLSTEVSGQAVRS